MNPEEILNEVTTPEELLSWILKYGKDITSWEEGFLTSLDIQLSCTGEISPKQEVKLNQIFDTRVGGRPQCLR